MEPKKITYTKGQGTLEVSIDHRISKKKLNMIGMWLALWTVCGLIILVNLFFPYEREARLMLIIWMCFWAYFEVRVFKAFKWKKNGAEKLVLENGEVVITRFNGKEESTRFALEKVKEFNLAPESKFRNSMNNSFWNIGEPALYFKTGERTIGFGRQLSREEAEKIERLLRPFIRRISS